MCSEILMCVDVCGDQGLYTSYDGICRRNINILYSIHSSYYLYKDYNITI